MPFGDLTAIRGIAVDPAGDVYAAGRRSEQELVLELPVGASTPIQLPFSGLGKVWALAVDHLGNVFVVDEENGWIVKSPALN
jgi:hypothetical protein